MKNTAKKTHYFNDGCGEPIHNSFWLDEFTEMPTASDDKIMYLNVPIRRLMDFILYVENEAFGRGINSKK